MKVCTDACLFGAWFAEKAAAIQPPVRNALDIGTGTGLLSLMLAQQCDAQIDAVELDEEAAEQAADNFELSPWRNRLQVLQGDIRMISLGRKYELIFSNPPFFENNLKSPDSRRNLALHSEQLGLEELLRLATAHLVPEGNIALLLPYARKEDCLKLAAGYGLSAGAVANVRQSAKHPYFRVMFWLQQEAVETTETFITIREGDDYDPAFAVLLKDYYLKL